MLRKYLIFFKIVDLKKSEEYFYIKRIDVIVFSYMDGRERLVRFAWIYILTFWFGWVGWWGKKNNTSKM